jgi:hypothetical protein
MGLRGKTLRQWLAPIAHRPLRRLRHGSERMQHYRRLGSVVISRPAFIAGRGLPVPDLKLFAIARELRDRAEEARVKAESFRDPETKRLMRQAAETYEEVARRLEREANDVVKA